MVSKIDGNVRRTPPHSPDHSKVIDTGSGLPLQANATVTSGQQALPDTTLEAIEDDALKEGLRYWKKRLAAAPPSLELPVDWPRQASGLRRPARYVKQFPKALTGSLLCLSETQGVTISATVLAGFELLLSRYSGQDDIIIGLVGSRSEEGNCSRAELFSEAVVTREDLSDDPTVRQLVDRVGVNLSLDLTYKNVPAELLGSPQPGSANEALCRIGFSFVQSCSDHSDPVAIPSDIPVSLAGDELEFQVCAAQECLWSEFTYDANLFEVSTIGRMAEHLGAALQIMAANPDQRVSAISLLTDSEKHQLLKEWNYTACDYPQDRCIHELFEEQVTRTPDAIAVVFESEALTYRELNRRANSIARRLHELGVVPDTLVGICVERSTAMIAALLGILKAGGAYVPLDPQYPAERLSLMLRDSELSVLLTEEGLTSKFDDFAGHKVLLDLGSTAAGPTENCSRVASPRDLAYVIYTSGSTGKPKGVQISHRALANFLFSMQAAPGLSGEDILLAVTTISFDIAALELFLPLITGARVVVVSRTAASDGRMLLNAIAEASPTVMQATPATWRLLLEAGWRGCKKLKILCGGERMPGELAGELLQRSSSVWNLYGPTETTVWSTVSRIPPNGTPITIGRPIANTSVYVLDGRLEPVPIGVCGELYIGGHGLARGYLNRPELTAERFVPNPFSYAGSGDRLYKTGDVARYRSNGELECLGRIDNQVKIRGFRVELGEIESALDSHPSISQSVVAAFDDSSGGKQLVAYVCVLAGEYFSSDHTRDYINKKLPPHMVPSRIVVLESFPLTPNRKVDRKALPPPEQIPIESESSSIPPRNSTEAKLVKIWEAVLGVRGFGVNQSFFELGGHSLMVARLLHRLEQAFDAKLSMASIFEAPTIEQQASVLIGGEPSQRPSAIVKIQPGGSRPPLFCFGYRAGPILLPLARRIGPDQPLLGIDPTLLIPDQLTAPYTMEKIASRLAEQMMMMYPKGPFYLGGFCGGGLLAYAAASQLAARKRHVEIVALFEPHTGHGEYQRYAGQKVGRPDLLKIKVKFHLANLRHLGLRDAEAYFHDRAQKRSKALLRRLKTSLSSALSRDSRNALALKPDIDEILDLAYESYRPEPFNGRVALFQATHREPWGDWERRYWAELASDLQIHEVPGYSNWIIRMLSEPNVDVLTQNLIPYLSHGAKGRE